VVAGASSLEGLEARPRGRRTTPFTNGSGAVRPGDKRRKEAIAGYLFVSPAVILFIVFLAGPLVAAVALSVTSWQLIGPIHFAGLSNFKAIFTSSETLQILSNTFYFTFGSIVLHVVPAFLLAALVVRLRSKFLKYLIQTLYVAPFLIGYASAALIADYLLNPAFGPMQYYAHKIGISLPSAGLLNSPTWAMPTLLGVDAWATFGFLFLIMIAGLQQVPTELYEAAEIDGAGAWRQLFSITLPVSAPTLFYAMIVNFVLAFQIFAPMYIMTAGGPLNRTESIVQYIYEETFQSFQIGAGAAMAVVSFLVIAFVTILQFRVGSRWVQSVSGATTKKG
jgi:ABC-type sugar transport system permease subunit